MTASELLEIQRYRDLTHRHGYDCKVLSYLLQLPLFKHSYEGYAVIFIVHSNYDVYKYSRESKVLASSFTSYLLVKAEDINLDDIYYRYKGIKEFLSLNERNSYYVTL